MPHQSLVTLQYFIQELLTAGYSLIAISNETGISVITLKRMLKGKQKKHRTKTIENLFSFYCKALHSL